MKYGKALLFCLLIASVFAISMFVYNVLFYFIFDTSRAMNDAKTIADMIKNNPNIPDKNKEEALLDVEKVTNLKTVLKNLSSNLIMGIVFGAISALFIRKKEKFTEVF